MKTLPLTIVFIFILFSTYGQRGYDSSYGKPLLVLTISDPWLMVVGSDVPTFVLYEKGQIIYKSIENNSMTLWEVALSKAEMDSLIKDFVDANLYKLNEFIRASSWTDQPNNILQLNIPNEKRIAVYGSLDESETKGTRNKAPKAFVTLYDKIIHYKNSSAQKWLPKKIEVMFWDYNYAPNKKPWLEGFPDLKSPSTLKFGEDSYSVFIDKVDFEKFKKYYRTMGEKEAVEINGRKMAISYRLPFPNI